MAKGERRDGRREAQWRRIIREQAGSGLTVRGFCRERKLAESAFYFWRGELRRREAEHEQPKQPSAGATFLPVHVAEAVASAEAGSMVIELPGQRRIHVVAPVDRRGLADVLAVLRFDELTTSRLDELAAASDAEGEGRPC